MDNENESSTLEDLQINLEYQEMKVEQTKNYLEIIELTKRLKLLNGFKKHYESITYESFVKEKKEEKDRKQKPLEHFLKSNLVVFGKDSKGSELYCREKVFVAAYNDYCFKNHLEPQSGRLIFIMTLFQSLILKLLKIVKNDILINLEKKLAQEYF